MKMWRLIATLHLLLGIAFGGAIGQTFTTIYTFSGGADGWLPGAMVQGNDGYFYGATIQGGGIFRISSSGAFTNFSSLSGQQNPFWPLLQGSDGNFYGTTIQGGAGGGAVIRISPSGTFTILYSFSVSNGILPEAGLVQGSDGNFYGTTYRGGTSNSGTVFRISPSGTFTSLYSCTRSNGTNPEGPMVQGGDGNFYGTALTGGTITNRNCPDGCGTVFRVSPSGDCTNIHSFGGADGSHSYSGLVQGSDGDFYGTTYDGGASNMGTVFRISPSGTFTSLYSFGGYPNDGAYPKEGLVQGSDGNFYGTTYNGGAHEDIYSGDGTVFRLSPTGTLTILHSFSSSDGLLPAAGLVQGSDGNFYGTTYEGGNMNLNYGLGYGEVFKISVPLNPPANQISSVQPDSSGTNLVYDIPSVAGETYQLQFSPSMSPPSWVNIPNVSVTNSIGAMLTLTNFGGAVGPQGFYRFAITP